MGIAPACRPSPAWPSFCSAGRSIDRLCSSLPADSEARIGRRHRCAATASTRPPSVPDRHRGGGRPPTPATPPCIRVRTRRFKKVALAVLEQRRKAERSKVCLGKPYVESLGERQIPGSAAAAGHIGRQLGTHPQLKHCRPATANGFPLPPQGTSQST